MLLHVCQGLRQICVSSLIVLNVFGAALVDMILQRYVEDPAIVSDVVYLDGAPKGDDGGPLDAAGEGAAPVLGVP